MKAGLAVALVAALGSPVPAPSTPLRVDYAVRIDASDLPVVSVEMHVHGAPREVRIAMATHPEYDDQYWRYLTDLTAASPRGALRITREDSAVWHISGASGDIAIRYRIHYPLSPPMQQAAWKAHLSPEGGLIGGPHSFLYVVGAEHVPVRVTLALPAGWRVATGLTPGTVAGEFTAPDAEALIDSPMMVGHFRDWRFTVDGVSHQISYLGHSGGVSFDSALFVGNVEKLAREAVKVFGWMPYHRFQFLFEDGAFGGLEHVNSISIGVRSADVARDPSSPLPQIAHEFFHIWNEVRLRPAAWIGIRHVIPEPTGELWWMEGVTLDYADLILRRAGLPTPDSTRMAFVERLITGYYANPSHGKVSPDHVSREFNLPPGGNGDYTPSMYTQGETLGVIIDLMIRRGSGGSRTLDDAMRDLARRFTPPRGYTGSDLERAAGGACQCDMKPFFDHYVRAAGALDFNSALAAIGLRAAVSWEPARNEIGVELPDVRLSGFLRPGEGQPRLLVWFPETAWGRAGLHTGDQLVSWNGAALADVQQLRTALSQLHRGDTVQVVVNRESGAVKVAVVVGGYERPVVHLKAVPRQTAGQRKLRARWMAGR